MPFVVANDLRFHVQQVRGRDVDKDAPTVVFVHGLIVDNLSSWWYTVANAVALRAPVLLYDGRGHGLTDRPRSGYTVPELVKDLAAVIEATGTGTPVHLVANSFGCTVATAFALAYPEAVSSLLLIEGNIEIIGHVLTADEKVERAKTMLGEVEAWFVRLGEYRLAKFGDLFDDLVNRTSLAPDLLGAEPFTPEQVGSIECPTLCIYGADSDILDRAWVIKDHIAHCEIRVIDDANHLVLTHHPDWVRPIVLDWISEQVLSLKS